jgi:DNA-binding transcriptional LysR family regulator
MRHELKVGMSSTPAGFLLPRLQDELHRALPDVAVRFLLSDSATVRDRVLGRLVELGLVGQHFLHEDLHVESWLEGDRLVVIVPPGSPLAQGRLISVRRLSQEPFIGRLPGSGTRAAYEPILAASGALLQVVSEEPDTASCLRAVEQGQGVSIVSLLAARESIEAGRVTALQLECVTLVRNLYLISHARATPSEGGLLLLEFLREWREHCHHFAAAILEAHHPEPPPVHA